MSTPIPVSGENQAAVDPVVAAGEKAGAYLDSVLTNPANPPLDQRGVDILAIGVFLAVALITVFLAVEAYQLGHTAAAPLAGLGLGALLAGLPWGAQRVKA